MSMLAAPDTITGPLRAEDLDRDTNPGNVWLMPRRGVVAGRDTCTGKCETGAGCDCTPLQPAGLDYQGRHETRRFGQQAAFVDTIPTDFGAIDDCAPEGGKHAEPVPSAQKKRDVNGARIGFVLLLLSATTVVGVVSAAVLARWPLG